MASRREYEMMFRLNAQLGSSYNRSFKSAQASLATMQNELQTLNKTQGDISAYQKQQAALETTKIKLQGLQREYDIIKKEMSQTGDNTVALQNKLLNKQLQIERTTTAVANHDAKLTQLDASLRNAGVDTSRLTDESKRLESEYSGLRNRQEQIADSYSRSAYEARNFADEAVDGASAVEEALTAAGIAALLKEIYDSFEACAEASIAFESAMTGVAKTTDLSGTELKEMGESVKDLSEEIPIINIEFAAVEEVAGQLGIAKENLLDFATVMSMLGTATTMAADEAATLLAQMASITRMDPAYYSNLASTIVDLGNNYSTTEQKITGMAQGIAASANLARMSEADMVALAAAVTSLGFEAQLGGTAISKLITEMQTAVDSGEDLELWARVAGMTAADFAAAWGDDAVRALEAFITGLGRATESGQSITLTLAELGITEARMSNVVKALATSGDRLSSTLETANRAWAENTALQAEAEMRYATTESQLIMLQNAYNNLQIAIGDHFTPILGELADVAKDVLSGVTVFVENNPVLVKAIAAAGIGVASFTAALGAYIIVSKAAAIATKALSAAMAANPYLLAGAAIIGVVTSVAAFVTVTDNAKESVKDLTTASKEAADALNEINETYSTARDEAKATADLVDRYIDRLSELERQGLQTTEAQREYRGIVSLINDMMPGLNVSIDEQTGLIEGGTAAIKAHTEALRENTVAQAFADQYAELYAKQAPALVERQKNVNALADAEERMAAIAPMLAAKNAELEESYKRVNEMTKEEYEALTALSDETVALQNEYDKHERAAATYRIAIEENTKVIDEYDSQLADLNENVDSYNQAIQEQTGYNRELAESLSSIMSRVEELNTEYAEAYGAAYESISGQMGLFESMKVEVELYVSDMIKALESQVEYMAQYQENIRKAAEMGLSEGLITQLQDGSVESAAYLQAIVDGGEAKIAELNEAFAKVEDGKDDFAGTIAEIQTEFSAAMEGLQEELENTVAEMDLNAEAAESGKNTMRGLIAGANDMLPEVEKAFKELGWAGLIAFNKALDINSPSEVFVTSGEMSMAGYIKGIRNIEAEMQGALSQTASVAADTMQSRGASEMGAIPSGAWGDTIVITLSPSYNISGSADAEGIDAILRGRDNDLRELILEALEEAGVESARRAYV